MNILVLNAGSSSQKSCLYQVPEDHFPEQPQEPLWEATIDWSRASGQAEIAIRTAHGVARKQTLPSKSRQADTGSMLETLWSGEDKVIPSPSAIDGVGHRVVHGGATYQASVRITPEVKTAIADLADLAPAHNPANLAGIEAIEERLGAQVPQVAVFDTAFHRQMPLAAKAYPGPHQWIDQGIQRYGFHGISHQYCAQRAAHLLGRDLAELRLITCHLGNGCSLAAIRNGHSVDTTMGFTPLDGVMMGSRSGAVDPGILIYLMRHHGYDADHLDRLLNKESGLKGMSGLSNDMREIIAAIAANNQQAQLAFDLYIHRLRAGIGAMLMSLGGLDGLVFTAGVGENTPAVRAAACEALQFLGVAIDPEQNTRHPADQNIATPASTVPVLVIHTQEDWAIAQECWQLLHSQPSQA